MLKNDGTDVVYLFCFASSRLLPSFEGSGIDGENPISLLPHGDITAVWCSAALDDFSDARMQDLTWIGPRAFIHEQVVERVMARSPVLPARFGTIFTSVDGIERLIGTHQDVISRFLDKVRDREEWALKGYANRAKVKEILYAERLAGGDESPPASPGARYLREQRLKAEVEKSLNRRLGTIGEKLAGELNRFGVEMRVRKVISSGSAEDGKELFINWAYLIPRDVLPGFREYLDRVNTEYESLDLFFHLVGPWPPYSFCPILDGESLE